MIVDVHAHCGKWFFPTYCESPREVGQLCDRHGIGRVVFSSSRGILYDMERGNQDTKDFVSQDDRFYGYVVLNPAQTDRAKEELRLYSGERAFVGVKLHPSYSGQPAASELTLQVLQEIPEGWVILVHTWGPDGVKETCTLAGELPRTPLIMGHMGGTGQDGWRAGIEGARRQPNVYLEICGSLLHYDRIAEAVAGVGPKRILFGSDLTLINPAFSIGQVLGSDIREKDKARILGGNAMALIPFDR